MANPQNQEDRRAGEATRDLASRIASAKQARAAKDNRASADASGDTSGMARGMRIGTEFAAAILVGAGIGYLIDLGLNTSPWGLLIMFGVGFAAGITNVIRVVTQMNAETAVGPAPTPDDRSET